MDIEFKDVPGLMNLFKSFFPAHFHIAFKWQPMDVAYNNEGHTKRVQVINVKVNDTQRGGEGEENWLLEYASTLLTQPKEMDECAKRWLKSFAEVKRKSTLDILGHKGVTIPEPSRITH